MEKTHAGLAVVGILIIADIFLFIWRPLGENFFIIADLLVVVLAFASFLFGLYAYKLHGFRSLQGKALLFLSLGIFFWFLGESAWAVYEIALGIEAPIASFADLMWYAGYPLFIAGLYYEWKITRIPLTKDRKFLAVLLLMAVLILVSWYGIIPTVQNSETDLLEKSVVIGYVAGDLAIMLGCSIIIVSFLGGKFAKPWIIITMAIILTSLADIGYSYLSTAYETGNWIDLLWDIDYLLLAYGFFYYRQSVKEIEIPVKKKRGVE
ncbi:MAG: hypothetical protein NTY20_01770 [Candidatus Aenigmarchaeota archaeon]|nr:hypothetical protein [Candidatus Aenigmarchaeota archaeon]